jgi:Flp pilus assembly protein TadG
MMRKMQAVPPRRDTALRTVRAFLIDERGSGVVLAVFVILGMMMSFGMAVDMMRLESTRVKIQNAVDRAVLAATDLDQTLDPESVVRDYLSKAGLDVDIRSITVTEGIGSREVTASVVATLDTLFLDLVGQNTISTSASGTAEEAIADIEITLVLDLSNSMNQNNRLANMKSAAREFVDTVLSNTEAAQRISVSLVPYTGQVQAGSLLSYFTTSGNAAFGTCVRFAGDSFDDLGQSLTQILNVVPLFDPWYASNSITMSYCPRHASQGIVAFSNDAAALRSRIGNFIADGNTSIDIGMRWANILQDPQFRPAVSGLISAGAVSPDFAGRPMEYGREDSAKFILVMSDGENFDEFQVQPDYDNQLSPVRVNSNGRYSVYFDRWWTTSDWFRDSNNSWSTSPEGSGNRQLSWRELLSRSSVNYIAANLMAPSHGGSSSAWYASILNTINPDTKDDRTIAACDAAKAAGTIIYAIGFEAPSGGRALLRNCASSPAHYFDVSGIQISQAFRSIARQINQLRLIQ